MTRELDQTERSWTGPRPSSPFVISHQPGIETLSFFITFFTTDEVHEPANVTPNIDWASKIHWSSSTTQQNFKYVSHLSISKYLKITFASPPGSCPKHHYFTKNTSVWKIFPCVCVYLDVALSRPTTRLNIHDRLNDQEDILPAGQYKQVLL